MGQQQDWPLRIEKATGASGTGYTIFYQGNLRMDFEITRPSQQNPDIYLCIPAAFTDLKGRGIVGLYIHNGIVGNKDNPNKTLGGAAKFIDGKCFLMATDNGKDLTPTLIDDICKQHGSLFQQILMIEKGVAATYKDVPLFQRRGIVTFKDGSTAIVEGDRATTLDTFSHDLAALGAESLLYTDMGAWDEGWYRTPIGQIRTIGHIRSQTPRQCNWVILKK